jgi:hypothetical protein
MHVTQLTSEQIKFLRRADVIEFQGRSSAHEPAVGEIKANNQEETLRIVTDAYASHGRSAYSSILYARTAPEWQTLVQSLRAGDTLRLEFQRNEYLPIDQGYDDLYLDMLYVVVTRKTKTLKFFVRLFVSRRTGKVSMMA